MPREERYVPFNCAAVYSKDNGVENSDIFCVILDDADGGKQVETGGTKGHPVMNFDGENQRVDRQ